MALYNFKSEKDNISGQLRVPGEMISPCGSSPPPGPPKEAEKRIRREIANCNERRRMQSINAGFQSLKLLLPHNEGEKLSKAAILQQTADHICRLEQEKTHLMSQVLNLKRVLVKYESGAAGNASTERDRDSGPESPIPPKKRKRYDSMMDEGIGSPESFDDTRSTASVPLDTKKIMEENHREIMDLRAKLDRERHYRMVVEERNRSLESQLYPEKIKEIAKKEEVTVAAASHAEAEIRRQQEEAADHHRQQQLRLQEQRVLMMQQYHSHHVAMTTPDPITTPAPIMTPTTSTSRQNLETIFQAIRHLEGERTTPGNTPVQTPSHTPTPDDEARKGRDECDDILRRAEERSVIRETESRYKTESYDERKIPDFSKPRGIKIELVHPLDKLTARPSIIVS